MSLSNNLTDVIRVIIIMEQKLFLLSEHLN